MKVLSFHLKGKMAHFRKYYSNSSALTYFIPPRTTVTGILAGLLGYKRDTYYENFSLDKCRIAVASCEPIKKNLQKMNYLMIKSANDLNGSQDYHSQTPLELVIPQDIRTGYVDYKVWLHHTDNKIMADLEKLMELDGVCYSSSGSCMALGSAFNLGWLQFEGVFEAEVICNRAEVMVSSAIPIDIVKELRVKRIDSNRCKIIKEDLPLEFDTDRRITSRGLKEILVNIGGNIIPAEVDKIVKLNNGEIITWLQ